MPLSRSTGRQRKSADARSAEIVEAAAVIALDAGLDAVTLRAVGAQLGVAYGLVNHYFPVVDELRAHAFTHAVSADLGATVDVVSRHDAAVTRLAELLLRWVSPDRDRIGLLWLDAWSHARSSPPVRRAVLGAMADGHDVVTRLLVEGSQAGAFVCAEPSAVAWRLLTLLDGQIVHSSLGVDDRPVDVREAVANAVETELSLPRGTLRPPA